MGLVSNPHSVPFDPLAGTDEEVGEDGIVLGDFKGKFAEVVAWRFGPHTPGRRGRDRDAGLAGWDLNSVER